MNPLRNRRTLESTAVGITAAERTRTILASTSQLQVGVLNLTSEVSRHAMAEDGSLLFLPNDDSPERVFAVAPNLPAQTVLMTAQDIAPIAHPDRIRGSVAVTGKLGIYNGALPVGAREHLLGPIREHGASPILRLVPSRISLRWHCETPGGQAASATEVDAGDYRTAFPDPMLPHEADWLVHLHRDHPDAVAALAAYGAPGVAHTSVRPVALDRHGLVIRLERVVTPLDVRLNFAQPVRCGCDLNPAVAELMDRVSPDGTGLDCSS